MTILCPLHFLPRTLVTFLVALGFLCSGMRVPDLSQPLRPHRPKAAHRLVWESPQKTLAKYLKPCEEQVAALPERPAWARAPWLSALSQLALPGYAFLPPPPTHGRSPPA
ncbi:hypothetical protein GMST_09730 [Geomonas silvestris]|uniref:Uncharacterized protein n=1 Tax=Geomonas silvestris TaxID=2740184 RepID=A0A6V8MF65_9BACT|nr:hypothetical protein [Geomonas silvestris]GFO58648.1 hypothetical protein GMST_09730 [Geomonas silvestris]